MFWFITENCDNAGVWEPDYGMVNFCLKRDVDWEAVRAEFGDRVKEIRGGKWWLTRFVLFQCGELKEGCAPHRTVIALLKKHGISLRDPWITGEGLPAAPEPPFPVRPAPNGATAGLPGLGAAPAAAQDPLLEALAAAQGVDLRRASPSERARLQKAAGDIRRAEPEASPERVHGAARAWKRKHTTPVTAMTIASHWAELTPALPTPEDILRVMRESEQLERDEARLLTFMRDVGDGRMVGRDDLTEEQAEEARQLQDRVTARRRALIT